MIFHINTRMNKDGRWWFEIADQYGCVVATSPIWHTYKSKHDAYKAGRELRHKMSTDNPSWVNITSILLGGAFICIGYLLGWWLS